MHHCELVQCVLGGHPGLGQDVNMPGGGHSLALHGTQGQISVVTLGAFVLTHCDITDISHTSNNLLEAVAVVYRAGSEQSIALQVHLGGNVAHGVLELGTGGVSVRHTSSKGITVVP